MKGQIKGKLEINRTPQPYYRFRSYSILLNGKKVGKIKEGETAEFTLAPRIYAIGVRIDWIKSEKYQVEIEAGKTKTLLIGNKPFKKWKLYSLRGILLLVLLMGLIFGIGGLIAMGIVGLMAWDKKSKPYLYLVDP